MLEDLVNLCHFLPECLDEKSLGNISVTTHPNLPRLMKAWGPMPWVRPQISLTWILARSHGNHLRHVHLECLTWIWKTHWAKRVQYTSQSTCATANLTKDISNGCINLTWVTAGTSGQGLVREPSSFEHLPAKLPWSMSQVWEIQWIASIPSQEQGKRSISEQEYIHSQFLMLMNTVRDQWVSEMLHAKSSSI